MKIRGIEKVFQTKLIKKNIGNFAGIQNKFIGFILISPI